MTEKIYTNLAPEPLGPYSQAIATDQLVFMSGTRLKMANWHRTYESNKTSNQNMQHVLAAAVIPRKRCEKPIVFN